MKNSFLEYIPLIELYISWALKLLPVPGLPTIINGIFVTTAKNNKNKFSFNDSFLPIPGANSTFVNKNSSSILNKSLKCSIFLLLSSSFAVLILYPCSIFADENCYECDPYLTIDGICLSCLQGFFLFYKQDVTKMWLLCDSKRGTQ